VPTREPGRGDPRRGEPRRGEPLRGDRGSMSAEMVLVAPLLVLLVLLVVAGGRVALLQGEVEAAARDAVRAASVERSLPAAQAAARRTVDAVTSDEVTCGEVRTGGAFVAGGQVDVDVTCSVPLRALVGLGLGQQATFSATASAPLETLRRTG